MRGRPRKQKTPKECPEGTYHFWAKNTGNRQTDVCQACGAIRYSHWTRDKDGNLLEFIVDKIEMPVR